MPALVSGWPAHCMKAAVGPLSTAPPTNGLTATTGAGLSRIASRMPSSARIGPIETIGFDGPITIARAWASASSTSGVGAAARAVTKVHVEHRTFAAPLDHELLKRQPPRVGQHPSAHRPVAHRQHPGAHARARP